MNLIDKYIAEVGKHLPRRNRADIEAEIRSTLEDMLEERTQGTGPADEATVMQLLKEYGSPREVAATYKTHQYLIGPRLFPIFEMVVRIVFAVVAGASLIGLGVEPGQNRPDRSRVRLHPRRMVRRTVQRLDRCLRKYRAGLCDHRTDQGRQRVRKGSQDEWDPKELKSEPDPDEVDMGRSYCHHHLHDPGIGGLQPVPGPALHPLPQ